MPSHICSGTPTHHSQVSIFLPLSKSIALPLSKSIALPLSLTPKTYIYAEDPATDSDTLSDGPDYEPISSEPDTSEDSSWINNGESYYPIEHISSLSLHDSNPSSPICNGFSETELGNGYFSLIPNGNMIEQEAIEEEEKDEREINASESAISTAFQEDEERRNAPLPAERSSAIIDAMRGVSFHGSPPPWVDRVPEDRWLEILRRSR
ncbi:hypothetical protein AMTRI_Chr08g207930 [Amborella trichopoda]